MQRTTVTLWEIVGLLAVGVALALGSNALRRDGLKLSKNYFEKIHLPTRPATQESPSATSAARAATEPPDATLTEADPPADVAVPPDDPAPQPMEGQAGKHGLQVLTFEEALEIVKDSLYGTGVCIFIDARNDEQFGEGHIPGALRLDPYNAELYLHDASLAAMQAQRIVIYCEGGDCEDSHYAARELLDAGIAYEKIGLYEGGMEDWLANNGPTEKGAQE